MTVEECCLYQHRMHQPVDAHLVSLLEEELGQVGTILSGNAGDERNLAIRRSGRHDE